MSQQLDHNVPHIPSIKSYITGFCLALILTLLAFLVVEYQLFSGYQVLVVLLVLAMIQTSVQLWYFLHIGQQGKPNWNVIFLANTIGIILLIVIASIWIMNSLHYRMMSPQEMNKYMMEQKDKGF